jgi:hypothetical protein
MSEGNEKALHNTHSWRPDVDSFEWYSRWAVDNMMPCDDCSPEYKTAYAKLQGTVEAADNIFKLAYQLYIELDKESREEKRHVPSNY